MKMDLASEVLKDLKGKRPAGVVVAVKHTAEDSRGARLLKAIKAEDAEAIDAILCESEEGESEGE